MDELSSVSRISSNYIHVQKPGDSSIPAVVRQIIKIQVAKQDTKRASHLCIQR
jgi:hypothetical protein